MQDILEHYGMLGNMVRQGDELVGRCPFHADRRPSFSASLSKNVFQCFAGSCSKKGNILDFVAFREEIDIRQAALMIKEWFEVATDIPTESHQEGIGASQRRESSLVDVRVATEGNLPLKFDLRTLDPKHPYLRARGLNEETIGVFGLGYCSRGLFRGRIAIPIHDEKGRLVAYAGRWPSLPNRDGLEALPENEPKYRLPKGFHKSLVVFNLHRAVESTRERDLILVEGFFGVFWLHQCGFPNVVALMGSSLSRTQKRLLTTVLGPNGKLTLLLDGDESGKACQSTCLQELSRDLFVKVARLPEDVSQPDELSKNKIYQLFAG